MKTLLTCTLALGLIGCSPVIVRCGDDALFRRSRDGSPYCYFPQGQTPGEQIRCPALLPIVVVEGAEYACTDRRVTEIPCEVRGVCADAGSFADSGP